MSDSIQTIPIYKKNDRVPKIGAKKTLRYSRIAICANCKGNGKIRTVNDDLEDIFIDCAVCDGIGKVEINTDINIFSTVAL